MVDLSGSIGERIERQRDQELARQQRDAVLQEQQEGEQQIAQRIKPEKEQSRIRPHARLAEMISEDSGSVRAEADNTSGYAIINMAYPLKRAQDGKQAWLVTDTFYKDFPSLIFHLSLRITDPADGATTTHYVATSMIPPESVQNDEMDYGFRILSQQQRDDLEKSTTNARSLADYKLPADEAEQVAGFINEAYELRQARPSGPNVGSTLGIPESVLRGL